MHIIEIVQTEAFLLDHEADEYIIQETTTFDNYNSPEAFVRDYSETSAREFVERNIEMQGIILDDDTDVKD